MPLAYAMLAAGARVVASPEVSPTVVEAPVTPIRAAIAPGICLPPALAQLLLVDVIEQSVALVNIMLHVTKLDRIPGNGFRSHASCNFGYKEHGAQYSPCSL